MRTALPSCAARRAALVFALLVGCGDGSGNPDAATDGATQRDASATDGGRERDASIPPDAHVTPDAGSDAAVPPSVACIPAPRCPECAGGETCGGGGVLHECGSRACTHYVAPDATATSFDGCTSEGSPCTLAAANAGAEAGDVVCLVGGEYRGTSLAPVNSGTASAPIVFRAADPAERPVIRGIPSSGTPSPRAGFQLTGVSFIEIDSIDVRGGGLGGPDAVVRFFYLNDADDCWIRNSHFHDAWAYSGAEILSTSQRARVTGCTFEDAPGPVVEDDTDLETRPADTLVLREPDGVLVEDNWLGDSSHAPISVRVGNGSAIVRRNVLRNRLHGGLLTAAFQGRTGRLLIEDNRILDTGEQHDRNPNLTSRTRAVAQDDGMARGRQVALQVAANGVLMRRNEVVNGGRGMWMTAYPYEDSFFHARHVRIAHNTFHGNVTNYMFANDIVGGSPAIEDVYVANNLFDQYSLRHVHAESVGPADVHFVRNGWSVGDAFRLIGRSVGDRSLEAIEAMYSAWSRNLVMDPAFVSASERDFRLSDGSPAIDASVELAHVLSSTPSGDGGTVLTVDDALWFFDGWGLPGQLGDVLMTASGDVLHVTTIDYAANTITVEETVAPEPGEGLAYAFTGAAGELGAHELCP